MTLPTRTYPDWHHIGYYTVRDTGSGARIVSSTAGWIVRVTHPQRPGKSARWNDRLTITTARMIYDTRAKGKTLPSPWGRVINYGGPNGKEKKTTSSRNAKSQRESPD